MKIALILAGGATALASTTAAWPATAAPTDSSVLYCGSSTYAVSGFGRGIPLKLTVDNRNYVIKFARIEPSGEVVLDIKGQNGRSDLITCTTTSPSGLAYTFLGFFTPRAA